MKQSFLLSITLLLSLLFANESKAQMGSENRNKIVMTINAGGKTVSADLNAISTSISRNNYEEAPEAKVAGKDSAKGIATFPPASANNKTTYYLSMEVKNVDPELLKILAKKGSFFDGTITITDSYGKNPTRKIGFTHASLYSYADQYSVASYDGGYYGNVNLSIMPTGFSVDGVAIE